MHGLAQFADPGNLILAMRTTLLNIVKLREKKKSSDQVVLSVFFSTVLDQKESNDLTSLHETYCTIAPDQQPVLQSRPLPFEMKYPSAANRGKKEQRKLPQLSRQSVTTGSTF